jgi:hypothetical protein
MMPNPAYPTDFVGVLELFNYTEEPSGYREEQWLAPTCLITCVWFPSNEGMCPSTILYKHF